ncbi:MAG: carboxypeptidase M32 [Candidatus Paceibacterota bacterium]|jgi:carboxypeptidase Taq
MAADSLKILKKRLIEIARLASVGDVLSWDQEVYLPRKGVEARANALACINGITHQKLSAIDDDRLLSKLKKQVDAKKLSGGNAAIVTETWRTYARQKKLSEAFVAQMSETTSRAYAAWVRAREESDFGMFLPWLKKIVDLKREEAGLVGFNDSPYDALIDEYEPGSTVQSIEALFSDLKQFLVPFIGALVRSGDKVDPARILGAFPLDQQLAFNRFVSEQMGFDYAAGRLDQSPHPFTASFHTQDVRITTRMREDDLMYALGSTIHETGHGLYEQGLPLRHFGTPLGESSFASIHESQSRLWENNIGRSTAFWKYFYPKIRKEFPEPFKKIPLSEFMRIINRVEPSLIRTEADEVTYNLHVILRFEIEKEMIEGTLPLEDLPAIWNAKMKKYLGISVPNDRLGVLQDMHWAVGDIGNFPAYTLGTLYAAQFYTAMQRAVPDLSEKIAAGDFATPREWLRENIYRHGRRYRVADLVKRATGEYPNSRYFIEYLKERYGAGV